jgi:hypothetical protein
LNPLFLTLFKRGEEKSLNKSKKSQRGKNMTDVGLTMKINPTVDKLMSFFGLYHKGHE